MRNYLLHLNLVVSKRGVISLYVNIYSMLPIRLECECRKCGGITRVKCVVKSLTTHN